MMSFCTGDCRKLRQYINKDYDCDARQSEAPHSSLLHMVAALTCTDCDFGSAAHSLLKGGAEMNAKNDSGLTPLMICAINRNERVATILLQAGADVRAACNQYRTALHWAAVMNSAVLTQLLLAAGASAAAVCAHGALALHEACSHGADCDLQVIKQLVSAEPGLTNAYSNYSSSRSSVTPLLLAISMGCCTEVAEFFVSSGADVSATDMMGSPVLMLAKEMSTVRLLLAASAAVNTSNSLGCTVLHAAAYFGRSAGILCCLLTAGADATATDTTGSTPAAVALAHGHTATAALLQRAEADQRSKQAQQQRQLAAPLSADRQILNGWQSSSDVRQRVDTLLNIIGYLKGAQWRSAHVELIALAEFELYRRAADIEAYSDVSTLQCRLNELVADEVILLTQLKQDDNAQTVSDSRTVQASTVEATAVSTPASAVINSEAGIRGSGTGSSTAVSSGRNVQQQQQQHSLPTVEPLGAAYMSSSSAPDWHCTVKDAPVRQQVVQVCLDRWLAAAAVSPRVLSRECGALATILDAAVYSEAASLDLYSCDMLMTTAIENCVRALESEEVHTQPTPYSIAANYGSTEAKLRQEYLMSVIRTAVAQTLADIAEQQQQLQQQQSFADELQASSASMTDSSSAPAAQSFAAEPMRNSSGAYSGIDVTAAAVMTASTNLLCSGSMSASTSDDVAVQSAVCSTTTGIATAADQYSTRAQLQQSATDSDASNTMSSSSTCETNSSSSSSDTQQQQQQLSAGAATATATAAAVAAAETSLVSRLANASVTDNRHSAQGDRTDNSCSSTIIGIRNRAQVTVSVTQHDSTGAAAAECVDSKSSSSDNSSIGGNNINSSNNSNNNGNSSSSSSSGNDSESKWISIRIQLLEPEDQRMTDAAVTTDSSAGVVNSNSENEHSSGSASSSSLTAKSPVNSSEDTCDSSMTEKLRVLQAQRVAAARQYANTTAARAAAAAAVVADSTDRAAQLQVGIGIAAIDEAVLIAAAEAAAEQASAAYSAQAIACKLLRAELRHQRELLLCLSNAEQLGAVVTADDATAASVQDELDSDVDCPPLALASSIEASDNTNTAAESMVAVGSTKTAVAAAVAAAALAVSRLSILLPVCKMS
jgi:ankyrin repeat protein